MKDSESKWYHHLRYPRVLFTLIFTIVVYLVFAGVGIYLLFFQK